jgi:hypothetical protein
MIGLNLVVEEQQESHSYVRRRNPRRSNPSHKARACTSMPVDAADEPARQDLLVVSVQAISRTAREPGASLSSI